MNHEANAKVREQQLLPLLAVREKSDLPVETLDLSSKKCESPVQLLAPPSLLGSGFWIAVVLCTSTHP